MENLKGKAGVYKIENVINRKVYVGSSSNLYERRRNHFNELKKGKHHNLHLQQSFQKYGIENFVFEVLQYIEKDANKYKFREELIEIEQYWIDYYNASNKEFGYNISKIADSCYGIAMYINNGKPVINLNTGKTFKSTSEAARFYGIKSCIADCCNGKAITAGGYKWAYIKDGKIQYNLMKGKVLRRKIINIEENKEFKSIKDAARYYDIDGRRISEACKSNKLYNNSHWKYVDDCKYEKRKTSNNKMVINLDTGKAFNTIAEASLFYSCDRSSISRSCSGEIVKAGGYEWAYIIDKEIKYNNHSERIRGTKVINIETGEMFYRIKDAAEKYNCNATGITISIKNNKLYKSYHWQYYEDYLKEHPKNTELKGE